MENFAAGAFGIFLTIFSVIGWFYSLFYSAKTQQWLMFTIDFVIPPIGVVHGWGAIAGIW